MARHRLTGSFTGTAQSAPIAVALGNNGNPPGLACALWGTSTATIQLERSRDNGTTWVVVSASATPASGVPPGAVYSSTAAFAVDLNIADPVQGDMYRWNCTAYTSGTANWDLAQ